MRVVGRELRRKGGRKRGRGREGGREVQEEEVREEEEHVRKGERDELGSTTAGVREL